MFYTHGWNTSQDDWDSGNWHDLGVGLQSNVDSQRWGVYGWDWTERSGNLLTGPGLALNHAMDDGRRFGALIAKEGYEHVHLIAHSAGSAMISVAAKAIHDLSPTTVVHTTFLDPYVSPYNGTFGYYGLYSDWSDNYSAQDLSGGLTMARLPHAHNVDVTNLDDNPNSLSFEAHGWPVEFYLNTILDPQNAAWQGYGFARSLEGGGWESRGQYPEGNNWVVFGQSNEQSNQQLIIRVDGTIDVGSVSYFDNGHAQVNGSQIDLLTASPAWIGVLVDVTNPINFITFDAQFLSAAGAEGLLAVYWQDTLLGTVDERYLTPGSSEYVMWLPQIVDAGSHQLWFRLDTYSSVQSAARIENIQTGLVTAIPEPSTVIALAIFALCLPSYRCSAARIEA